MTRRDLVTREADIMNGEYVIANTRIPVCWAWSYSIDRWISNYPNVQLTRGQFALLLTFPNPEMHWSLVAVDERGTVTVDDDITLATLPVLIEELQLAQQALEAWQRNVAAWFDGEDRADG